MNIVDFTQTNESSKWRIINDGVMGGVSHGCMKSHNSYGIFSGVISLENNGGFSSTVRPIQTIAHGLTTFIIDVESKQQPTLQSSQQIYQLRAIMQVDGYRLAYKHNFILPAMTRAQLYLPLHAFEASFRGRIISNAPTLISNEIIEIGLLIKSQLAGDFSLCIHTISAI